MPTKRTRPGRSSLSTVVVVILVLLLSVAVLSACSFTEKEPETQTVSEYNGLFHFKVPAEWQTISDSTLVAVYAAEELPKKDELETLSVIVVAAPETTETPVPVLLEETVERRATDRGWSDVETSEPEPVTVGGREGYAVEIAATDANGIPFRARFYLVRTSEHDVLIAAIAPEDTFDDFSDDLDALTEEWYWHQPPSKEPSVTAG